MTSVKALQTTQFGNPILRQKAKTVTHKEITSSHVKQLISEMRQTLKSRKLGVGLAAPQVGKNIALAVIRIRPTSFRPKVNNFDQVLINPEIIQTIGRKSQLWEGCISSGVDKAGLFAKVPRYKSIKVKFYDETGHQQEETYEDLPAHVIQHEVDHLNGVLFVDHVKDTSTYMTFAEYKKRIVRKHKLKLR